MLSQPSSLAAAGRASLYPGASWGPRRIGPSQQRLPGSGQAAQLNTRECQDRVVWLPLCMALTACMAPPPVCCAQEPCSVAYPECQTNPRELRQRGRSASGLPHAATLCVSGVLLHKCVCVCVKESTCCDCVHLSRGTGSHTRV